MSTSDLLTKAEGLEAAAQGWSLENIYELHERRWKTIILPHTHGPLVVTLARAGSALAVKALRLVMASHEKGVKV